MTTATTVIGAALFIAVCGGGAAAQHQHATHGQDVMDAAGMQKMIQDMTPQASDAPSTKALKEAHLKMLKAMHIPLTGRADEDFVRGMIPHHQGAIDMARAQIQHGKNAQIRKMAQKIIADQQREIRQMEAWLRKNAK